jgi:hypothetical protein
LKNLRQSLPHGASGVYVKIGDKASHAPTLFASGLPFFVDLLPSMNEEASS